MRVSAWTVWVDGVCVVAHLLGLLEEQRKSTVIPHRRYSTDAEWCSFRSHYSGNV